jgi:diguanylate cyclase (GGDEF)-like protein
MESILRPRSFEVLKAFTGQQALELARRANPDLIAVDFHLSDMDGIDVVRELRERRILDPVTPLLMLSSTAAGRAERLEALGAGAWDILSHPLDPGELLLRLENLLSAKNEADRLRRELITDPATGFYNARGLLRRVRELSADSLRSKRPLACIVVGPEWDGAADTDAVEATSASSVAEDPATASMAEALRNAVRASDPVGRLGPEEFVVILSGVDGEKATELANRIVEQTAGRRRPQDPADAEADVAHAEESTAPADLRLRAGISVTGVETREDPERLLSRATLALRRAQAAEGSFRIQTFDA